MIQIIALLAAGYLARWAQEAQWTWPLMRVRCRRGKGHGQCTNTVWRLRWGRLAPLSIVCRGCGEA